MAISTVDGVVAALAAGYDQFVLSKASLSNAAAGQVFSLWRSAGVPGQAAIPSTAAIPTEALLGAITPFTDQISPATSYLAYLYGTVSQSAISVEIHDRVAHMGGLSGTVTTAQGALPLTGLSTDRRGPSNFSALQWWIEIFTDLGATGVNATVAVVYDDASTANIVIALGATPRAGRMYPIVSTTAGRFIASITSVTLSATTGTAGNFGLTCTRQRGAMQWGVANKLEQFDWAALGMPECPNDSCLQLVVTCSGTTTPTITGGGKIIHG